MSKPGSAASQSYKIVRKKSAPPGKFSRMKNARLLGGLMNHFQRVYVILPVKWQDTKWFGSYSVSSGDF